MKKLLPALALFVTPFAGYTQARIVINGITPVTIVENGGSSATPVFIEINNPNTNAITVNGTAGAIISESEFNMVKWDIGTSTGLYSVPFGFSATQLLPVTLNIGTAGTGANGNVRFSTYHTIADQLLGVQSVTGDPSDVTNVNPFILPGSPSNADNSYNIADRFYIVDADSGYSVKPTASNITFSYISGMPNSEVTAPNILKETDLMAERYNSGTNTWSDWFGEGCTDAIVNGIGTVQTGPVPLAGFFRSWALWDNLSHLPLKMASTNASCSSGGTAAVTASGGSSPYTYSWTGVSNSTASASGLTVGTYTVSVTDKTGCLSTASVAVGGSPPILPNISVVANSSGCVSTGIATSAATGGSTPYTYSWSNGGTASSVSNLSAGTYTLTVTDKSACSGSASVVITAPAPIAPNVTVVANASECARVGDLNSAPTGGLSPYTYHWTNGSNISAASGLSVGGYTLTVTDNAGCTGTASATITAPAALSVTGNFAASNNSICTGSAWVVVSGGTGPYTYSWKSTGITTDTLSGQCPGNYCCYVTDKNGCTDTSCILVTGIQEINNASSISIYPDPNSGSFTISGLEYAQIIQVYNEIGQMLTSAVADKSTVQFDISTKPNGVYLVKILNKDGTYVIVRKIVKAE